MPEQLSNFEIRVRKLSDSPHAKLDRKHKEGTGDTGYDLFLIEDVTLDPGVPQQIRHGIAVALPPGYASEIRSRSSTLFRKTVIQDHEPAGANRVEQLHPADVQLGTIDNGYRDELRTAVINHGQHPIHLKAGDRISQLVVVKVYTPEIVYVDSLDDTERGTAGWGSTGTHEPAIGDIAKLGKDVLDAGWGSTGTHV